MSLKEQIEEVVGDLPVGERTYTEPTGREMTIYSVNNHGVVLQFAIASEEDDPGVIEDFLEDIVARVKEVTT